MEVWMKDKEKTATRREERSRRHREDQIGEERGRKELSKQRSEVLSLLESGQISKAVGITPLTGSWHFSGVRRAF